jgi:hypothetical protein
MYPKLIKVLRDRIAEILPGSTDVVGTYEADDPDMHEKVEGVLLVQYTPYDRDGGEDGCTPQARVKVFYEDNKQPMIDKSWDSPFTQGKSKRQSCKASSVYNDYD